jgi:hypothetical protein
VAVLVVTSNNTSPSIYGFWHTHITHSSLVPITKPQYKLSLGVASGLDTYTCVGVSGPCLCPSIPNYSQHSSFTEYGHLISKSSSPQHEQETIPSWLASRCWWAAWTNKQTRVLYLKVIMKRTNFSTIPQKCLVLMGYHPFCGFVCKPTSRPTNCLDSGYSWFVFRT